MKVCFFPQVPFFTFIKIPLEQLKVQCHAQGQLEQGGLRKPFQRPCNCAATQNLSMWLADCVLCRCAATFNVSILNWQSAQSHFIITASLALIIYFYTLTFSHTFPGLRLSTENKPVFALNSFNIFWMNMLFNCQQQYEGLLILQIMSEL